MRLPSFADPANLVVEEVEHKQEPETIPDDIPVPEIADRFVRGKQKLSREQQSMLKELLPFHMPKLTAVAHFEGSFAEALEQAIERRANRPPPSLLIEAKPVPTEQQLPAEVLKKPMSKLRRF